MSMIDLKFDSVSKRYSVREEEASAGVVGNKLMRKLHNLRRGTKDFWAVRDVSFEVERGEALGIIGHNGAGKSTMLKLLSSITAPTSGEITINGRLAALIEVGSGFHPELTGRENIFLSGSILGMNRREIAAKLDSIIDFAGVREFIDTPVKRYSSGMYVRLGFSIAAHLDPDILLLDEVLAVGDADFQAKCFERVAELQRAGTTIVFISHDLSAVKKLCSRALMMERGQIIADGLPGDVIDRYTQTAPVENIQGESLIFENALPDSRSHHEVLKVELLDRDGRVKTMLRSGDYVRFRVTWRSDEVFKHGGVEMGVHTLHGVPLFQYSTRPVMSIDVDFQPGLNVIELELPQFPLTEGAYYLMVGLTVPTIRWLYRNDRFGMLTVGGADLYQSGHHLSSVVSMIAVPHRWIAPTSDDMLEKSESQYVAG